MESPTVAADIPVKSMTPQTSVKSKNFFSVSLPTIQNPLTNIHFSNPLRKSTKHDISIKDIKLQANVLSNNYESFLHKFFTSESQILRKNLEVYDNTSQKCVEATTNLRTFGQSISRISSQTSNAGILASRLCGYIVEQPSLAMQTTDEELIRLATANMEVFDINTMMPKYTSDSDDSDEEQTVSTEDGEAIGVETSVPSTDVEAVDVSEASDANDE